MKFLKILAVILTVCMLGAAFVACDSSDGGEETEGETTVSVTINVTLIIKDGSTTVVEGSTPCNGTLGDAIEMFCAGEGYEADPFDENGLLSTIGDLTAADGKNWKAYYADQGQSKAFESIKDQALEDGKTIVVVLE